MIADRATEHEALPMKSADETALPPIQPSGIYELVLLVL